MNLIAVQWHRLVSNKLLSFRRIRKCPIESARRYVVRDLNLRCLVHVIILFYHRLNLQILGLLAQLFIKFMQMLY